MDIKNKIVLITGGSRGIGRAIVKVLSKEGPKIIFTYNKSKEKAQELVEETNAIAIKLNIMNIKEIKNVVDEVYKKYGTINLLVNNAGVYYRNEFFDSTEDEWDATVNTNLKGTFFMTKYVAKRMPLKESMIINIASDAGIKTYGIEYGITKNAVIYLTKVLSKVLEIKVNCICPSYTNTDMAVWSKNSKLKKDIEERNGKINEPEDVAAAVVSLAKLDDTGRIILVKNGRIYDFQRALLC